LSAQVTFVLPRLPCHTTRRATLPLILLGIVALVIPTTIWQTLRKPAAPARLPYTKRPSLLTTGEQRFGRVLLQALPPGVAVFALAPVRGNRLARVDEPFPPRGLGPSRA
jgi:hypothetical protein